ncbi:MAG TPA: radical SAM protein [Ruminococcaceae bacterium]|nr:radical SAM protein [Oscillospiraceae bacterium]
MPLSDEKCNICPRECGVDRSRSRGFCKVKCGNDAVIISKAMLHFGEEPVISGTRGSGAVFFGGCNLGCVFCQNYKISSGGIGKEISLGQLGDIFLRLQDKGAHNINLVTGTHFVPQIAHALKKVKPRLEIPVVFNCGGYEKTDSLKMLEGLVDIYLPDIKYYDNTLAEKYSGAKNYFETATAALEEMLRQRGKYIIQNDLMKSGVIVRHLILPNCYKDSIRIFTALERYREYILISLMRQYFPSGKAADYPEINRRLTTFEYRKAADYCADLGFKGFTQEKGCDNVEMTPDFDHGNIIEI